MTRRIALVVTSLICGLTTVHAVATSPAPSPIANGIRCRVTAIADPQVDAEVSIGVLRAGVLVAASPGATITVTCTIQVGAANSTHAGSDSCWAQSGPTTQAVVLPPTLCSYSSPEGQPVYLCTEIDVNGTAWYWDATPKNDPTNPEPATGWTTSTTARCDEVS